MRRIGSATDRAYFDYWHNIQDVQTVVYNYNKDVKAYQDKCRYHEENVTEMADAILGERLTN